LRLVYTLRDRPPRSGGGALASSRSIRTTLAIAVLLSLAVGALFVAPHRAAASADAVALPSAAVAPLSTPAATTHGDLVVASGQSYTIRPVTSGSVYYQEGNITVQAGGTLTITGVVLSFVQFVMPAGTPAQRLAHIYHFTDDGTVLVQNSTITTDVIGVNIYPKLLLSIGGTMTAWNSTFAFPGWINVAGVAAALTLNGSLVERNPGVTNLSEWPLIRGDTNFAPDISVTGGASLNLFGSNVTNLYSDNFTANGVPRPAPLTLANDTVANGSNDSAFTTPTDSANLTRDWLYPSGITGGEITLNYSDPSATRTTAAVSIWYNGINYPLGSVTFLNFTPNGQARVSFTPALTSAINTAGMLSYLNFTGAFGVSPSKIAIQFGTVNGPEVLVSVVSFSIDSPVSNDISVSGAGSRINAADANLNLTFNDTPASPLSLSYPLPWLSNKLVLTNGAVGMLGNLTINQKIHHVFNSSAILADGSSNAYLFRWATFSMTGLGGFLPVQGGTVTTYYAYNSNQANNVTANTLNALQTSDPAIWGYLQSWDSNHGYPAYATSGPKGVAAVLLLSSDVTGSALPNGYFLGGYHVFVTIPVTNDSTAAFNWSVSAYPAGVALATPSYGMPDNGPVTSFNSYYGDASISAVTVPSSIRIGQVLTVNVTIVSTGPAPIFSVVTGLFYNASEATLLSLNQSFVDLTPGNPTLVVSMRWQVNDSVTGDYGNNLTDRFNLNVRWNNGDKALGGGIVQANTSSVSILPSVVTLSSIGAPPNQLEANTPYLTTGVVTYNGSHPAKIELIATPTSGGAPILLAVSTAGPARVEGHPVNFELDWNTSSLNPGTSYTFTVYAIYNSVNQTSGSLGTFEVPSSTSGGNLLTQKFLGEPLWLWLAIAAGVVLIVVGLLLFSRRQAAGKLVECGECGNLIPEDARVCPKCGAEFEADVVRCSRCASTIPASSKYCPECAAQLLGRPEEASSDPERQAYADFTERYRAEGKKELGENYTEGAFWDWWKRQPSYTPFSQWKLQQSQGAPRADMAAPPGASSAEYLPVPPRRPPSTGRGGAATSAPPADSKTTSAAPKGQEAGGAAGSMKACPSCSREIPSGLLVCPFCGSVTQ
jgi:RNA polymerase subunit RPABC4/transcription elongation factor Spt4